MSQDTKLASCVFNVRNGSILPFGVRANKRTCAKQSAKGLHFDFSNCTLGGTSPTKGQAKCAPSLAFV